VTHATKRLVHWRDLIVGMAFGLTNAIAHLVWNPLTLYWQFAASALAFTVFLVFLLLREWRRLRLFVTRFYCIVATLDLLAEGLLQPWHQCTAANLACTGRMFLVFFIGWLVLHPLESWFSRRKAAAAGTRA
jgi:hypothetical protein